MLDRYGTPINYLDEVIDLAADQVKRYKVSISRDDHCDTLSHKGEFKRFEDASNLCVITASDVVPVLVTAYRPSGKYYTSGVGVIHKQAFLKERSRDGIFGRDGHIPGLSGFGREFILVVEPDDDGGRHHGGEYVPFLLPAEA